MKTAAIIGISNYARHHLLLVAEQMLHQRIRLAAATVINPEAEAFLCARLRRLGCKIFARTDLMWREFRGQIDLCIIPTGIHLHADMTIEALHAGASVLVEKPLAASLQQAQAVMRAERETRRFVAVGFQHLYTPATWKIKRALLNGRLGTLQSMSFTGFWPRPASYYTRNDWAGRLRRNEHTVSDSPVSNAFAHFLNLALFWAGESIDLSARVSSVSCELYRTRDIETFDTCCARARLSTGCEFRIFATHSSREDRPPRLVLRGSGGTLTWEHEKYYEIRTLDGSSVERREMLGKFETQISMGDAVVDRLYGRQTPICTTLIACEHLQLVEALHHAAPIVNITEEFLLRQNQGADQWTEIKNIETATEQADASGRLWSELGVPWARARPNPQIPAATC